MSDRRKEIVQVPDSDAFRRDVGKTFLITEWNAPTAEAWAYGIVFALKGSQGEIPLDVARLGAVGVMLALMNTILKADIEYAKVRPFYDELLTCVQIIRDPSNIDRASGGPVATPLLADDVSEVATRGWLRSEVFRVHTNFSFGVALSGFLAQMKSMKPPRGQSTTRTSRRSSGEPSPSTPD